MAPVSNLVSKSSKKAMSKGHLMFVYSVTREDEVKVNIYQLSDHITNTTSSGVGGNGNSGTLLREADTSRQRGAGGGCFDCQQKQIEPAEAPRVHFLREWTEGRSLP